MPRDEPEIRPETHALDALIRETVNRTWREGAAHPRDAMLFLGNRHQAFPALVVQDPVLEPVDKIIWMVIYQSARGTGARALFPGYADIARLANVSSTSTVARAIAILRATRWLSLCARIRDAGGRFSSNVYALHDEPLPLADALHLDPGYMAFLKDAEGHHHARVRRIAAAVCASMDEDIQSGTDVLAPQNTIERRLEAVWAVHQGAVHQGGGRRYFSFSAAVMSTLANTGARRGNADQDQNSKAVNSNLQNSKSASPCSSRYIYKTTTTETGTKYCTLDPAELGKLVFPRRLKDNHRELAARYLARIPQDQRQPVLDELAGRLEAAEHGAKPIYDEIRYLHQLCATVNRGRFNPNLGLKVQDERERRRKQTQHQPRKPQARERKRHTPGPAGEKALAEIRKQLGTPPSTEKKPRE